MHYIRKSEANWIYMLNTLLKIYLVCTLHCQLILSSTLKIKMYHLNCGKMVEEVSSNLQYQIPVVVQFQMIYISHIGQKWLGLCVAHVPQFKA